jgi:hypothetical protein
VVTHRQGNDLVFCQPDGRPWLPDHVSKRFKRLATEAGVPVVKLNEGGRHTGNSLIYDAEIRPDLVMRRVGRAGQEMSRRYNHPERQAHLAASARVHEPVHAHRGDHRRSVTERYRRQSLMCESYGRRATWSIWTTRRSSSIV